MKRFNTIQPKRSDDYSHSRRKYVYLPSVAYPEEKAFQNTYTPPTTTTEEPPVTTTEEPPVTTTEEPPVTTTEEPPVTTTEEQPPCQQQRYLHLTKQPGLQIQVQKVEL